MNWLNLRTEILHSPEFIGCHPTRRATWLSLSLWCASQENGGIVSGGANWSDRQWQQTCGVTKDEATDSCELFRVEDRDVVLWGYPVEREREIKAGREYGRIGGIRSGEARRKSLKTNDSEAPLQAPLQACLERKGKEGNRKGIGIGMTEAVQAAPAAALAADQLALSPDQPPSPPTKAKRAPKQPAQTDAEWLASLAASPAYAGLDVGREHAKASEWCRVRQQTLSRQRFVNWLNRADKPLTNPPNGQHRQGFDHRSIATHSDREQLRTFTH